MSKNGSKPQITIEKINVDDVCSMDLDTLSSLRGRMNQIYVPEFKKRYMAITNELWGRGSELTPLQADELVKEEAVIEKTIWSRRYIQSLPDESFAYVEKDVRIFPYKNADGKIDMSHLKKAIEDVPKSKYDDVIKEAALKTLRSAAKRVGVHVKKRDDGIYIKSESKNEALMKSDEDQHIVTSVVYEPNEEDAHGHIANEETIREAAYSFMTSGQSIYFQHLVNMYDAYVLESYLAPQDLEIEGQSVKKGSWIMSVRVWNNEVWEAIKAGEITGFSLRGRGILTDIDQ